MKMLLLGKNNVSSGHLRFTSMKKDIGHIYIIYIILALKGKLENPQKYK